MRPGRYDRAPPAPRRRWNLRATRRQQLLEELDAIIRTLTAIALAAPSPLLLATGEVSVVIGYMLMMTSWLTMISMALDFARTSASAFYAKRRLGAHGSGAMLPGHGPRRRVPPPTLDDWSDDLAVARTRFDVIQLRAMLHGFGLMRIDGSPKRYRVYQSGKLYSKKRPGGGFYKSSQGSSLQTIAEAAPCRSSPRHSSPNAVQAGTTLNASGISLSTISFIVGNARETHERALHVPANPWCLLWVFFRSALIFGLSRSAKKHRLSKKESFDRRSNTADRKKNLQGGQQMSAGLHGIHPTNFPAWC